MWLFIKKYMAKNAIYFLVLARASAFFKAIFVVRDAVFVVIVFNGKFYRLFGKHRAMYFVSR